MERSYYTHSLPDFNTITDLIIKLPWLLKDDRQALLDLWQMCEEKKEEQELITSLLERFEIQNLRDLRILGDKIANHITETWGIIPSKQRHVKIVALNDDKKADGSQFMLQTIKNKFVCADGNWNEDHFVNSIGVTTHSIRSGQIILFVDDFIGTGKTVDTKVRWFITEIEKKEKKRIDIKILAFAGGLDPYNSDFITDSLQ